MQSSLNRDLNHIHKWILCIKLTLNSTKTEVILIGSSQKLSTLSESLEPWIYNVARKQVSTSKSLWILIDDNMAWHSYIDKLSKKIASVNRQVVFHTSCRNHCVVCEKSNTMICFISTKQLNTKLSSLRINGERVPRR